MTVAMLHRVCSSASVDTVFLLVWMTGGLVTINTIVLGWQQFHAVDGRGVLHQLITICFSPCNFSCLCPSNFPLLYV